MEPVDGLMFVCFLEDFGVYVDPRDKRADSTYALIIDLYREIARLEDRIKELERRKSDDTRRA